MPHCLKKFKIADGVWVFGHSCLLLLNKYFDLSTSTMRKGDDKGDTRKNGKKKIEMMLFIVATNVIASLPPECRQTGMLTAHAKIIEFFFLY